MNSGFDAIKPEEFGQVVEHAYRPLFECLGETGIKSTIFPTGSTLRYLLENHPDVIDMLQGLLERNNIEIGNHTYGHPIIPLIANEDLEKQIQRSQGIEEQLFGEASKAFYPPEFCIDPTIPHHLQKYGIDWMLLHVSNYMGVYGHTPEDVFKVGTVKGILNSQTRALTAYGDAEEWIRGQIHAVFEGVLEPRTFAQDLTAKIRRETDEFDFTPVLTLYTDSETPFFNRDDSNSGPVDNFKRSLDYLLGTGVFTPMSASEVMQLSTTAETEIHFKMRSTYKPFQVWTVGSEKLDSLIAEARHLVYRAAAQNPEHQKIDEMWHAYLVSQTSDARSNLSERREKIAKIGRQMRSGAYERTLHAYDNAVLAKELAEEILHE